MARGVAFKPRSRPILFASSTKLNTCPGLLMETISHSFPNLSLQIYPSRVASRSPTAGGSRKRIVFFLFEMFLGGAVHKSSSTFISSEKLTSSRNEKFISSYSRFTRYGSSVKIRIIRNCSPSLYLFLFVCFCFCHETQ